MAKWIKFKLTEREYIFYTRVKRMHTGSWKQMFNSLIEVYLRQKMEKQK